MARWPGPEASATIYHADVDNTLTYMDQGSFLGLRALGRAPIMQFTWILSRRGRHRRVAAIPPSTSGTGCWGAVSSGRRYRSAGIAGSRSAGPADIAIAAAERPRAEIAAWADERIVVPIDPERGPAWHLGVLPLADGGDAVTLVVSHSVADALGLTLAIADASEGIRRELGYPVPGSATRRQALLRDVRRAARDLPEVGRAILATARVAREQSEDLAASAKSAAPVSRPGSFDPVIPPTVTAYVDLEAWDERAGKPWWNKQFTLRRLRRAARATARPGRCRRAGHAVIPGQ